MGEGLCGSGLARDSGVSDTYFSADTPLSRASPLPQLPGKQCWNRIRRARTAVARNTPARTPPIR
ncbi:hypothetical protein F0170_00925 [Pseudomonas sp. MAFF 730085]|uniref:Uncharacterized protein n=1 Tax=Pseudomonas kitaguniensis TaxID=2607908 RepID=A0A5N7JMU4_9PSED|nr:hypothetical protein [Pseudomonas kitaguniensis]